MTELTAENFTPTKWDEAAKKARLAKQFVRFVESDFNERYFNQPFYQRLALCFGHIAHFNRRSFYETFFASIEGKVRFLRLTLQHPCWGDAAFTYADVERALQSWLRESDVLAQYESCLVQEKEAEERAPLTRLQAKY